MNSRHFFLFLVLFFCFQVFGQKKIDFSSRFKFEIENINKLALCEDSLINDLSIFCKETSSRIDNQISVLKSKKEILTKYNESLNQRSVPNIPILPYNLSDLKEGLDIFLEYNELSLKRKQISICQKELKAKTDWLIENIDSLNGTYRVRYKNVLYDFYVSDLTKEQIALHQKKGSLSIDKVKGQLEAQKKDVKLITNAGMYTLNNDPEGLFISEQKQLFALDTGFRKGLNFYMLPNGVFYVDTMNNPFVVKTDSYRKFSDTKLKTISLATQSGPMLLIDGDIHPRFNRFAPSKKIRSGVGVFGHKVVFAITREKSNFFDFASFFQDYFNCQNALFLDGAISKMYLKDGESIDKGGAFGPVISISEKK